MVDLELEKAFDRVSHDVLTAHVARKVADKPTLQLIRRYLQVALMADGIATACTQGTLQGVALGQTARPVT